MLNVVWMDWPGATSLNTVFAISDVRKQLLQELMLLFLIYAFLSQCHLQNL